MSLPIPAPHSQFLEELPNWSIQHKSSAIVRDFTFSDFPSCMSFLMHVAFLAEQHDHHPEFTQCYNRLSILLTTHDINGLSNKDLTMAHAINHVYSSTEIK